jgi:hypothetical protein
LASVNRWRAGPGILRGGHSSVCVRAEGDSQALARACSIFCFIQTSIYASHCSSVSLRTCTHTHGCTPMPHPSPAAPLHGQTSTLMTYDLCHGEHLPPSPLPPASLVEYHLTSTLGETQLR